MVGSALSSNAYAIDLPVQGGSGGGPFRIQCDPGSFVIGFEGRTGAYIDNFRILCGSFDASTRKIQPRGAVPITIGTSNGGGPAPMPCPAGWAMHAIDYEETMDHFVHHINFRCASPVTPENIWRTYGPTTPVAKPKTFIFSKGSFLNMSYEQSCPAGQFAIGLQGRSGLFVDALGLICEPLPAPPPQTISPNYQPNTTFQNKPSPGKQALTGPSPPPLA